MVEALGVATAFGMAVLAVRLIARARLFGRMVLDELRFLRSDVADMNDRFARIVGERAPWCI